MAAISADTFTTVRGLAVSIAGGPLASPLPALVSLPVASF
jgi:hypothetical protein